MGGVIYGYPFEETLAVSALIFGGVLERHPLLDIVISHGGGASAMLHGRMREFSGTSRSPITTAQFDTAFGRLWFDTHVHSAAGIELLRSVADPERLVYGSNFGGWDSSSVDEVASIADTIERNAARLLRLR
jgi:aminocarboxymuconate-semialdehyde decarboxylase